MGGWDDAQNVGSTAKMTDQTLKPLVELLQSCWKQPTDSIDHVYFDPEEALAKLDILFRAYLDAAQVEMRERCVKWLLDNADNLDKLNIKEACLQQATLRFAAGGLKQQPLTTNALELDRLRVRREEHRLLCRGVCETDRNTGEKIYYGCAKCADLDRQIAALTAQNRKGSDRE